MPEVVDLTETVERELMKLRDLPAPVQSWRIEIGEDASGDMAVWVWAVVDDAKLTRNVTSGLRSLIFHKVSDAVPNAKWVYVRFRATSEEM